MNCTLDAAPQQANGELLQWLAANKPPEDDRDVLVWIFNGFRVAYFDKYMGWVCRYGDRQLTDVTFWADVVGPPAVRAQQAEVA